MDKLKHRDCLFAGFFYKGKSMTFISRSEKSGKKIFHHLKGIFSIAERKLHKKFADDDFINIAGQIKDKLNILINTKNFTFDQEVEFQVGIVQLLSMKMLEENNENGLYFIVKPFDRKWNLPNYEEK